MMLHAEKIDDKGKKKAHRKMGRKIVPKQMGRFLGNSLTECLTDNKKRTCSCRYTRQVNAVTSIEAQRELSLSVELNKHLQLIRLVLHLFSLKNN